MCVCVCTHVGLCKYVYVFIHNAGKACKNIAKLLTQHNSHILK